jgi:NADPH-dependent ferric siderophore reductase
VLAREADWHLFAADESGLPATLAMLEALPRGTSAVALLDVAEAGEVRTDRFDDVIDLRWLVRGDIPAQHSSLLVDSVRALELPPGRGHGYLAAELLVVNAVRDALRDRGFGDDQLAPKAYWRADQANAQHGEPARH